MSTWVAFTNIQGHFDHWKYTDNPNCSYGVGGSRNDEYSVAIVDDSHYWAVYVPVANSIHEKRLAYLGKEMPLEEVQTKAIELAVINKLTSG